LTNANTQTVTSAGIPASSDTTSPGPVTNLNATPTSTTSITLTWQNPTDSDLSSLLIYRSTQSDFQPNDQNHIATLAAPTQSYIDQNLTPSTTYHYLIRTRDTNGNIYTSLFYPRASATTLTQELPEEPTEPETPETPEEPIPPPADTGSSPQGDRRQVLLKTASDSRVYYVSSSGVKKHIPNPEVFLSYGNRWEDIITVTSEELMLYPVAHGIRHAGDIRVYVLEGGEKRWVISPSVFNAVGLDWNLIVEVNQAEFESYPEGSAIEA
ncbi:MAG: fibronectin type III domain-containing protein, partial [Candidatus Spechtbacterales bacterium]